MGACSIFSNPFRRGRPLMKPKALGFMNVTQCVFCCFPLRCPTAGAPESSPNLRNRNFVFAPLEIKTLLAAARGSTQANPRRSSSPVTKFSVPYFRPTHPVAPLRSKWRVKHNQRKRVVGERQVGEVRQDVQSQVPRTALARNIGQRVAPWRLSTKVARWSLRSKTRTSGFRNMHRSGGKVALSVFLQVVHRHSQET